MRPSQSEAAANVAGGSVRLLSPLAPTLVRRFLSTLLVAVSLIATATAAWSDKSYSVGRIETPKGEILFVLFDRTPHHKESFMKLAASHYWDSLTFNRVIKNFVAQGGCPDTPAGFSGSPYLLAPEFSDSIKHVYGAVGAGRDDNPGQLSAGCQFYIVANKDGLPKLDNHYTVYGQVFKGMDVVESIVSVPKDSTNMPLTPITLHIDVVSMSAKELKKYGYVAK
jgi:peptidyl-prolyl cis-trans isomerase B (cyclophilin B)